MAEYEDTAEQIDSIKPPMDGKAMLDEGKKWLERIRTQQKVDADAWTKDADCAVKIYGAEDALSHQHFNILYSNIETVVPSIYNSTPVPDIRRRFGEADPVAKEVANTLERYIKLQCDNDALDTEFEQAALGAMLAGRGLVRLRLLEDGTVQYESVAYRDFVLGPCKRFRDAPWEAFRQDLTKEDQEKISEPDRVKAQTDADDSRLELSGDAPADVVVWEVWCKASRKVKFIRERDGFILKEVDDPLKLKGFFPNHEPIQPITKIGSVTPVNPYKLYEHLAKELDTLSRRIKRIVEGMKVRGGVAAGSDATDAIKMIADAEDNELVAVPGMEMAAQNGGIGKMVVWWPIEAAAVVVRELSQRREEVKQAIYEITGISDIVRGASRVSETATAQQIKSQWGSLRIKKLQRQIERAVREVFQMTAEIASSIIGPQSLAQITGIELSPEAMQLMAEPVLRNYRVDVESDSTIRADVARNQEQMNLFLAGTAQYMSAVGPAVMNGAIPKDVALEIYSAFARSFKLGRQAEDALDRMAEQMQQAAQQPPGPSPEQQAEQAKAEAEQQAQQQRLMMDSDKTRMELDEKQARLDMDRERHRMEMARMQMEAPDAAEMVQTGVSPIQSAIQALGQMMLQAQAASDERSRMQLEGIMTMLAAPKVTEIIKDEQGRAVAAVQRPHMSVN